MNLSMFKQNLEAHTLTCAAQKMRIQLSFYINRAKRLIEDIEAEIVPKAGHALNME